MNDNDLLWVEYEKDKSPIVQKKLLLAYVNLVHYVIHRSKFVLNGILDERDYFQYGVEGLNEAIKRYRINGEQRFETFAIQRIRGKIIDELKKLQNKKHNNQQPSPKTN